MEHPKRTRTVTRALTSLAKDERLRAVALSGPWGTGKTYLVNEFVEAHASTLKDATLTFAYVSLFGVQNLAEARARLAASTIKSEKSSLKILGKKLVFSGLISGEASGFDISKIGDLAREVVENAVLKDLFICIDDLERAGADLRPIDVLGFISELTEQRRCKVLLVLNKDKLADGATVALFEEKVFDLTLDFRPTPDDVIHLAIENLKERNAALPVFREFGSANIRVMRRLSWVLSEIGKIVVPSRSLIWPHVVRQAAIYTLLKFERGLNREMFEKVLGRDEGGLVLRHLWKEENQNKPEPDEFSDLLDKLDHQVEVYDRHIVDLLHDGSFNEQALKKAFSESVAAQKTKTRKDHADSISRKLRGGLKSTAAEMSKAIKDYFSHDISVIHPATVAILSDALLAIDPSTETTALVTKWLTPIWTPVPPENRKPQLREFPTLWASGIVQQIPYESVSEEPTVQEAFDEIASARDGWDTAKLPRLVKATADEIRKLFLSLDAPDSMFRIRWLRERVAKESGLSKEDQEKLQKQIDQVIAEISAADALHKYQLHLFARPRAQT